jgi:phosphopantothenoylcysteine decarboxylase/phosphopantothenate--cysteine ligase
MPPASAIVLAVSGGLLAYRAAEVARLLTAAGARVIPVMTAEARRFLGPATLEGLTGEPVRDPPDLPAGAGVLVLFPAPAAPDDALTTCVTRALAAGVPILAAPDGGSTRWAALAGEGRLEIVAGEPGLVAEAALARRSVRDLGGLRVVVSAGPTVEDLDPVRFLGNRSTGKMGFALAARAAARGAVTTLVAGPVSLPTPFGVRRIDVRGALAMRAALWAALGEDLRGADALVMSAAVADYRPAETHPTKRKRSAEPLSLDLVPNPDLLAEIGAARGGPRPALIGFAVETDTDDQVVAYARGKLVKKRVDLVVANHASDSFGRDDNRATIVDAQGAEPLGVLSKPALADRILDRVLALCQR